MTKETDPEPYPIPRSPHEEQPRKPPPEPPDTEDKCKKIALLVGIGDYKGSLADLGGPIPDVEALYKKLIEEFDFDRRNIQLLTDDAATKKQILDGLHWLVRSLAPGDVGVFYYSGHGTQTADIRPFDEDDKLDEAIVPYDALAPAVGGVLTLVPGKLLRDDEIHTALDRVPHFVNFSVIFDSCHSGTATRGLGVKGRSWPPTKHVENIRRIVPVEGLAPGHPLTPSNHVLLAASKASQTALDTGSRGLFSEELVNRMRRGLTYQELHDGTAPVVARRAATLIRDHQQEPQIEGPGAGRKIFECLVF